MMRVRLYQVPGDEHVYAGGPGVWYTLRPDVQMVGVLHAAAGLDDSTTIDAAPTRPARTSVYASAEPAPGRVTEQA